MKCHSELKMPFENLLPPLSIEEYESLEASIKLEGIRDAIIIDEDDNILDGHHRYIIEPSAPTRVISGLTDAEKRAFVLQSNYARRNLSPEQKKAVRQTMIGIAKALRAEDARKNTQARIAARLGVTQGVIAQWFSAGGRGHNITCNNMSARPDARVKIPPKEQPKIADRTEKGESTAQIAADYGIAERTVRRIVTKEKNQREAKKKVESATKKLGEDIIGIHYGDFREVGGIIADDSVDLILTDPPYDQTSACLYGDLAVLAARVLKPGGWCLAYSGHQFLPDILVKMCKHLEYGWIFGIFHSGGDTRFRKYKLQVKWKPLVGFFKPPLSAWWNWFSDVATGGKEKDDHKWQQAIGEAEHFISAMSPKNGVIFDPMCGSGTSCLGAKNLGRQWIGIDIDKEAVNIARSKLM